MYYTACNQPWTCSNTIEPGRCKHTTFGNTTKYVSNNVDAGTFDYKIFTHETLMPRQSLTISSMYITSHLEYANHSSPSTAFVVDGHSVSCVRLAASRRPGPGSTGTGIVRPPLSLSAGSSNRSGADRVGPRRAAAAVTCHTLCRAEPLKGWCQRRRSHSRQSAHLHAA